MKGLIAVALVAGLCLTAGPLRAEPAAHELTAADLEAFLDGQMPVELARGDIAGAVVAVVKDGRPLLVKGYGFADRARGIPVSPESTLFRPGSVSKLFTWTAVMQQVELGRLDLDRDVNAYLDFRIPPAHGRAITLRDLMTHRAGFEESLRDLFAPDAAGRMPLGEYLRRRLPPRLYEPGAVPAYSNYGCALAGYVVQRVSGEPFDDYVETHILRPLGMRQATFHQPLPDSLASQMSCGYELGSGKAMPFEVVVPTPAGALSASGAAMARFMIAHLQDGELDGARILEPATARTMHARQDGWPAGMNAMALGFYEDSRNGHRILAHGGDSRFFHSDLHLILDAGVGLFVSFNSTGRIEDYTPRTLLFDRFMDRYFPAAELAGPPPPSAVTDMRAVAGTYHSTRRFEHGVLAVSDLMGQARFVYDPKDSTLVASDFKGADGRPRRFREVAPLRFREVGGHASLMFEPAGGGRYRARTDRPIALLQPVTDPLARAPMALTLFGAALAILLATLLGWPIAAMIRRHHGRPLVLAPGARRLRSLVRLACVAELTFVIGLLVALAELGKTAGLGPHGDVVLRLLQLLGLLGAAGAVLAILHAWRGWREPGRWIWARLWDSALALALIGCAAFAIRWGLLGLDLRY